MLNPSDYNNQNLDKDTKDQLFKLFVEGKLSELKQELIKFNTKIERHDVLITHYNTRLTKLESKKAEKPVDYSLDFAIRLNDLSKLIGDIREKVAAQSRSRSVWDIFK